MCGISGIVDVDLPRERRLEKVRVMGSYLDHRGPDAWGEWSDDCTALGHNRLAILDLEGGAQPMVCCSGQHVIVFNGEIYNFRELRKEIQRQGGQLRTDHSDTEAIVEGYRLWGERVFRRLDGMFACAIWTPRDRRLVLARDRAGIKPLYYSRLEHGGLAFASEPKALIGARLLAARLDDRSLPEYFLFRAPLHPGTLFKGVSKLAPGTLLTFSVTDSSISTIRFSEPSIPQSNPPAGGREEHVVEAIRGAVASHLVADVEVGVFLSGGVDSSLVMAMAAPATPIKAFTVTSPGPLDELSHAKDVARRFGADLIPRVVQSPDMLAGMDAWAYFNDDPVADPSALALMLLAKEVNAHGIKVMLSGEGGDELFGGYTSYTRFLACRALTRAIGPLPAALNKVGDFRTKEYLSHASGPFWGSAHVSDAAMRWELLADDSKRLTELMLDDTDRPGSLRHAMTVDQRFRLPNDILMRTDRATMAYSIEARVPLLANEVVDASQSLPDRDLCRLWPPRNKPLLKAITANLVGRKVVYRRKVGFDLPIAVWLGQDFQPDVRRLIAERRIDGLAYSAIARWYDSLCRGASQLAPALWAWFVLEAWHQRWICGPPMPLTRKSGGAVAVA